MFKTKKIEEEKSCQCHDKETINNIQLDIELMMSLLHLHGEKYDKIDMLLYGMYNLLVNKGMLKKDEILEAVEDAYQEKKDQYMTNFPNAVLRVDDDDKNLNDEVVNCEERIHICKGACCKLSFALSREEVEAGQIKWDIDVPYYIRHDDNGYCSHMNCEKLSCSIYNERPSLCRKYSCRDDERIWKDFDKMILNDEFLVDVSKILN